MFFSLAIILAILIAITFYKWTNKNYDYFKKRGIKYVKPKFLLGSTGELILKKYPPNEFFEKLYYQFPDEKLFGIFDFLKPLVVLRDAEMVKQISIRDFDYFTDHHNIDDDNVDALFGNSLVMLRGKKWRDMRTLLTPAFTGTKLRQMFVLVRKCAENLSEHLSKEAETKPELDYEVKDLFSKYSNDVIATTSFGVEINSFKNPNNEFYKTGLSIVAFDIMFSIKYFLLRTMPAVMKFFHIHLFTKKLTNFFKNMVVDSIKNRIANDIVRPDMINILMDIVKDGGVQYKNNNELEMLANLKTDAIVEDEKLVKETWTINELVAQCFIFFAAGFETVSSFLTFASYELVMNPDVQQRVYEEIVETQKSLNGRKIEYDDLNKMKYMNMFISEVFRMWPPGFNADRVCVKDYKCPGLDKHFKIEKGTTVWIPIYSLHHDSRYFEDPYKFDPGRFSDENKANIVAGSYLPFGIGPRNCVASRFALIELKVALYFMLLKFTFCANAQTQIPLKMKKHFRTQTERGVDIRLTLRN